MTAADPEDRKSASPAASQAAEFVKKAFRSFELLDTPKAIEHPDTKRAQDLLHAAEVAVRNMQFSMHIVRAVGRDLEEKDPRGRISDSDADLLRAMIAYAGAGLDAALKRLIRDTVRDLIRARDECKKKFVKFAERHLATPNIDIPRLTELLIDDRVPQEVLFEKYERELTGDSLQSVDQVDMVCGALGVNDPEIRKRLKKDGTLDSMFKARNEIVHQLDLDPKGGGRRTPRSLKDARTYATEALSVAQLIINEVAKLLAPKAAPPAAATGALPGLQGKRPRVQEI